MKKALVLCTGNSCRSIMAEALINHLGEGAYRAHSAGSAPTGYVHPRSIDTLARQGVAAEKAHSKSWNEFANERFDVVITVCDAAAKETCPVFPGAPKKLKWSIPDPAAAHGSDEEIAKAFEEAFQLLKSRIEQDLL